MTRNYRFLLMVFSLLLAGLSCKKDKDYDEPPVPPVAGAKEVQIQLPSGVSFDLSGAQLSSFGQTFEVSKSGKTQAFDLKATPHIAWLFDKENKPLMAGFITDSTPHLSPASTAKVLLYLAYGVRYRSDTVTKIFINKIGQLPGVNEWIAEFTGLWNNDPLILSKAAFVAPLRKTMEALKVDRNPVDIAANSKPSDLIVDEGDFKSGVQLFQSELSQLSFHNNYRRRAHAFLYKMKYRLNNGDEHVILKDINSNTAADKDLAIDPAAANTSLTGQLGALIEGKGDDIFLAKSGPVTLELNDTESEVIWKVHVVGPGVPYSSQPITNSEIAKQTRLEVETFAIDFMMPLIMETMGWSESLAGKGIDIGSGPVESFIDKTDVFIKSAPDVYEEIKKGDYKQAAYKALAGLSSNVTDKFTEDLILAAYELTQYLVKEKLGNSIGQPKVDIPKFTEKGLGILKVVNAAILGTDYMRMLYAVSSSHQMEEWEVKARSGQVKLSPRESKMIPLDQQKITAEIKNVAETGGDTHPFFEWSSSGKFGYLKDTKGNEGKAFGSADKDVFYNCTAKSADLSDGDNWEYIYVTAKMGDKVIGKDTARINVRKYKYRMLPKDITLSGRKGSANEVKMYLERLDGVNDIKPNSQIDFKIVWTTPGKHGGLSAPDLENAKTVTTYDKNTVTYSCKDEDVKQSTETIKARIYSKRKDEATFRLFDEVSGTVKIENDEKKKIIHVPLTYLNGCWTEGNCYTYPVAVFKVEDSAKKYRVRFYNFTGIINIGDNEYVYSWDKDKVPPTYYSTYPETKDIKGGNYYISTSRTWCTGPPSGCNSGSSAEWVARYRELYGTSVMAEVTYYY
ncbi:MAG: hypothetical protein ACTHMC_03590 [Pseudobacter sp.]|uniref:hypothetical protein n=1 Tax=Pseudobacter sp. TaxID=2045420 RepID=UPI003F7E6C3E